MSLSKDLNWRYATKDMNGKKVTPKKLNAILDAINLAPTSYGLQPFKVIVVSRGTSKTKLMAAAYNQKQVGSSSHVLVFCVHNALTPADIQTFVTNVATTRGFPVSVLDGYKGMMMGTVGALPPEQQQTWAAKQVYLALGFGLIAAAEQKVDSCPMEGFDATQVDTLLGLQKKGLKSVLIMPLGYRAADDAAANFTKVRKAKEDIFEFVK
jgi:nitroreductase / dihydropteridine reductase